MPAKLVLILVVAACLMAPAQAQQQRPIPQVGPPAPAPAQDLSWYPLAEAPPFLSELAEGEDGPDVIHAGSAVVTIEDERVVPVELTKPLLVDGRFDPGWFLVHFETPVEQADKEFLDTLTGPVRRADGTPLARWYVPNQTLAAWVDSLQTLNVLAESTRVDWVGRYEPGYKLDPTIGTATLTSPGRVGRSSYVLNVDVIPGHPVADLEQQLLDLGAIVHETVQMRGASLFDVTFLVVEVRPRQVLQVAALEGVRMVQEAGDGVAAHDVSGGGKLQNRNLAADDVSAVPIVTAANFPLWINHDLQGQGQLIGVVDSSMDWNNAGTSGCNFGFPDTNIDNYGFALPNLSRVLLGSVGSGGVNLKIPRADLLGGATLLGVAANEHGSGVAGAALADFYGNDDTRWWQHDPDQWDSWAPTNYSGLLGPGIAHEAQLYFTPVMDSADNFRWESFGEFESHMGTTLTNMAVAGVSTTNHSVGLAEASNTYTQVSVVHDTKGYDHPTMLQCMAAGNDGAGSNKLTSQAVVKNGLAVGASDDVLKPEDRVTFSSTGPRFDGGLKPDIMAPGSDTAPRAGGVQSLLILPDTNGSSSASCAYQYTAGTSFAAPIMAGAGALVHQYFEEGRYSGSVSVSDPSAALMKAMLINAGERLTGANLGDGSYPNMYQGWGEPNLSRVFDFGTGNRDLIVSDVPRNQGFTGAGSANDVLTFTVDGSAEQLKITLAWTDEPGGTGTGKKLINDLDLVVTAPGGATYRGNVFNGSAGTSVTGGSADTLNNLESVILNSPATGTWTATVDPGSGNYAAGQGYALVITGDVSEGGGGPTPPSAAFSGTPTSGTTPLSVSFSDLSGGSVSTHDWTFGDGGTSTAANPSHTYTSAGSYTVSLTVSGPGGTDTETKVGYITVSEPPPVASFSGSPTSGEAPLAVAFNSSSSGSIDSWSWSFGDGGTSSAVNPSHTYTTPGSYTVSLTVTGPGGSDTQTRTNYISVDPPPPGPPTAAFSGSPTSGTAPLAVTFTNTSSGSISSYAWTFGDGGSSSSANPSHTYTSAGTYTVSLTVTGPGGSDVETKSGYIVVDPAPPGPPVAGFSGTPTSGTVPLDVSFSNTSTGDISSYSWDFGDGGSSSAANPVHTYTSAGTYTVSLTVTGPGGSDVETRSDYITVSAPPSGGGLYYLSFTSGTAIPGVGNVADEDVVTYDPATGTWARYFDGSDVGVTTDVNAVHVLDDGSLVLSFNAALSIPGLIGGPSGTSVDDSDLVLFVFNTSGANTSGTFQFIFDGSDVGLTTNGEDIDGVYEFPGGGLAISTLGSAGVPGLSGVRDEDVMYFTASQYGAATAGSFSLYFDGSDVGFSSSSSEDLSAITFEDGVDLLFSTVGSWSASGGAGADEDVGRFSGTFGAATSGSAALELDLTALGIASGEDVDGLCYR